MVNPFHAEMLIRNKILEVDNTTEVVTQCFDSLMKVTADESLAFVSRYLDSGNEVYQASAALAMGESRLDEALDMLIDTDIAASPRSTRCYRASIKQSCYRERKKPTNFSWIKLPMHTKEPAVLPSKRSLYIASNPNWKTRLKGW